MAQKKNSSVPALKSGVSMRADNKEMTFQMNGDSDTEWLQNLPILPTLAQVTQEGRLKYGMTMSEYAEATGLSVSMIHRIETGKTLKPAKKVLRALSPYIGISYNWLLLIAGYSEVNDKEIYYNKLGEIIQYSQIIADIYKADSDFLEVLRGVDVLAFDDLHIIKLLILLMKKDAEKNITPEKSAILKDIWDTIKVCLKSQLSLVSSLCTE